MDDEEEEILTSDFSVAELWQHLPAWLKEETFGYLDIRHGNRLCSVSTDWQFSLLNLAQFNGGIAFFLWPLQTPEKYRWGIEEVAKFSWKDQLLMNDNSLKHLVFVGMNDWGSSNLFNSTILVERFTALPQPLNVVTFYRSKVHGYPLKQSAEQLLSRKSYMLRFAQCEFVVLVGFVRYFPSNRQYYPGMEMADKFWFLGVQHPFRVLTAETVKTIESNDDGHLSDDPHARKYNAWILGEGPVDFSLICQQIWPYPEEELRWLEASLNSLPAIVTPEVGSLVQTSFHKYCTERRDSILVVDGREFPKTNLKWSSKDLDILDCAFFARVLSVTPGIPKPPYELPDDLVDLCT